MGSIVIFNKLPWKPAIASKLIGMPTLELNLSYSDEEIAPMPGKQRSVFNSKFKAGFDAEFDKKGKAWMKKIQEAVTETEARLAGKDKAEMEQALATANQLLKQAFTTWQSEMTRLCEDCVTRAYEASVAAMQKKLIKAKIKAVCTIALIAGLVLTAAALAIAAAAVSGGALAPLVLGAIATGAGALYKAYKVYDTTWASSANKITEIQGDIKKLENAIAAYKRSETSYAGLVEKAKALKATLMAPVSDITKHVGQLDKYIFDLQATIMQQKASLAELGVKAREAKSGEVDAAVKTAVANMDRASDQLKAIAECTKAAEEIQLAYSAQKLPDYGKLNAVVTKLGGAGDAVSLAGSSLKTCFQALKVIGVAMPV